MTLRDTRTYSQDIQKGTNTLKHKRIAVCVLARNCEKQIAKNMKRLRALEKKCAELRVYVLENDSVDNTRAVLKKYTYNSDMRVQLYDSAICKEAYHHIVGETRSHTNIDEIMHSNDRSITEIRMKRMALLRDGLLYVVKKDAFVPHVLLQIDIDVHWFDVRGIIHSFASYDEWDALNANGRLFTFCQYALSYDLFFDSYALLPYNTELKGNFTSYVYNQYKYASLKKGQPHYPVYSAFGGISLQKYPLIKDESYYKSAEIYNFECCEHVSWYKYLREKYGMRIYINPSMLVHYNSRLNVFVYSVAVKKIRYKGLFLKSLIKTLHLCFLPCIFMLKLCGVEHMIKTKQKA